MLNSPPKILKEPSFHEWLLIFPEAKNYVKIKLKREIEQAKKDLENADKLRIEYKKITSKLLPKNRWFWEMVVEEIYLAPLTEGREKIIKKNSFLLSSIKERQQDSRDSKITEYDIQKAKEVPLTNFLTVDRAGFAHCPFHKDDSPSLKIYKTNKWWCYSCNSGVDTIDFIMRSHNLKFIEAVKFLIGK